MSSNLIQYTTKNGNSIWCLNEAEAKFLCDQIYADKEYDTDLINFDFDKDSLIIDIGSNIGLFSMYASEITNKKCNIIAIEPVPELQKATIKNLNQTKHKTTKFEVYQYAVGDTSDISSDKDRIINFKYYPKYSLLSGIADNSHKLTFNEKLNIVIYCLNGNYYFKTIMEWFKTISIIQSFIKFIFQCMFYLILDCWFLKSSEFECKLYSLDEILDESSFNSDQIDLVKIDVEKAELNVLSGIGSKTWKKIKQIAIEVHDIDNRIEKVKQMLTENGFKNIHVTDKAPPKFYNFIVNGNKDNPDDDKTFKGQEWNELVANIYATK